MVELEFSGLLSMWEQAPSWQRRAPCALRFMRKPLASALPYLDARTSTLEIRVEKWRTISLQLGSWYDEGRRGEGVRFDRENVHQPVTRQDAALGRKRA